MDDHAPPPAIPVEDVSFAEFAEGLTDFERRQLLLHPTTPTPRTVEGWRSALARALAERI